MGWGDPSPARGAAVVWPPSPQGSTAETPPEGAVWAAPDWQVSALRAAAWIAAERHTAPYPDARVVEVTVVRRPWAVQVHVAWLGFGRRTVRPRAYSAVWAADRRDDTDADRAPVHVVADAVNRITLGMALADG